MLRLAFVVALALLPGAQAALSLQAHDVVADLVPGAAPAPLLLDLSVACGDVLPLAPTQPVVALRATQLDPGLQLGGELAAPIPVQACLQAPTGTLAWQHNLTLAAAGDAPGLATLAGTLQGTIDRAPVDELVAESPMRARVAFVGKLLVEVGEPVYDPENETGSVRLAITNQGNAKATARIDARSDIGPLAGPTDQVVETGAAGRVVLEYGFSPSKDWETATVTFTVTGHAFAATVFRIEAQTVTATFTNTAVAQEKDSPGPTAALALVLLALAMAARRRLA